LKTIILLGEGIALGEDVAADVWTTRFELPTAADLESVLAPIITDYKVTLAGKVKFDDAALGHFTRACAGLPEDTARSLLSRSITRFLAVDNRAVTLAHEEKRAIVKRSGVATLKEPRGGMELVGGLAEFKNYIGEIDPLFQALEGARKFGCRFPAGVLMMGVPGTGKSLMAEALAGHWKLPMLTMEMGAMFGGLVGESEGKLRKFQALAKAIKPCLVFADEIEKGIGGGGGENDGGTTERVKQSLLTWLQEKDDEIIVVATANRIEAFNSNPEFLRRFDTIWFVDLPDHATRMEIAAIHLKRAGHEVPAHELQAVATASKSHSGAEIEKAVQITLRRAFAQGGKVTGAALLEAVKEIVPLSVTMAERIDELRAYCKSGRARSAGPSMDADPKPVKSPAVPGSKVPVGPQI
jgi:ATP-dependent 26S proteasome regulatory subunit